MTKPMNCQTAHQQLQELLDRRWNGPMPSELQEHLTECQVCHNWQTLFHLQPRSPIVELSSDFSQRVVSRYTREQRRYRWIRTSSILALAASVVIAAFVWLSLPAHQPRGRAISSEVAQEKSRRLYQNVILEWSDLQARVSQLPAPSFTIPAAFRDWEMEDVNDPLAISMPALRTIGSTLQGAIEPYEAPARETMKRVQSLIDEPEVKKWVDNVKRRAM
jgi:hypothetical protein